MTPNPSTTGSVVGDGVTLAAARATIRLTGAVAAAASYVPARRAARIEPLTALRYE